MNKKSTEQQNPRPSSPFIGAVLDLAAVQIAKTSIEQTAEQQEEPNWRPQNLQAEFLLHAREAVEKIIKEAETEKLPPKTLFLELHYPFFDKKVQNILKERAPSPHLKHAGDCAYAVDAYLWAEQYGWLAYDDSALKDSHFIDSHASFYFTRDLHWFSRLLTAVAADIKRFCFHQDPEGTLQTRLQAWRNRHQNVEQPPNSWLEGTSILSSVDTMASVKVTASKINRRRRTILRQWLPSWKAEIQILGQMLLLATRSASGGRPERR